MSAVDRVFEILETEVRPHLDEDEDLVVAHLVFGGETWEAVAVLAHAAVDKRVAMSTEVNAELRALVDLLAVGTSQERVDVRNAIRRLPAA